MTDAEKFIDYLEALLAEMIGHFQNEKRDTEYGRGLVRSSVMSYEFIQKQIQQYRAGTHSCQGR